MLQGEEREAVVPALTGVFAEALKGGVSNLSFGDLSGQLGAWPSGHGPVECGLEEGWQGEGVCQRLGQLRGGHDGVRWCVCTITTRSMARRSGSLSPTPPPHPAPPAGRTMYQFKFQIPPYYTLLVRSLSVLEVGAGGPQSSPSYMAPRSADAHLCSVICKVAAPLVWLPTISPAFIHAGHCAGLRPQLQGAGA